ncbi:hypothetical protein [Mycetocola saprophilus]|uniref:hypothetical protein n=1 Tax=Mycetocola saprophilus TaxID=76636 RepID=UPI0004BEABAB|nr:hypothetical protein [Mycetocola saprophilus]
MPSTVPSPRPWWRRVLTSPAFWALVSLSAALPWVLTERGMGLPPMILSLLGGWLLGIDLVNRTFRARSARVGLWIHVALAVACSGLMIYLVESGSAGLRMLPEPLRAPAIMVQFALIPATGWMVLGVLGRITTVARRPARNPRTVPEWVQDKTGFSVGFRAVRMPVAALVWWGVALGVMVATVLSVLIVTDALPRWVSTSPMVFLLLAALIALPPFLVFRGVCALRTVPASVRFTRGALLIAWDGQERSVPLQRITRLVWCSAGESARVEIASPELSLSLLVSVARPGAGELAQLPPLPRRTEAALVEAGLMPVIQRKSRPRRSPISVFERVFESNSSAATPTR